MTNTWKCSFAAYVISIVVGFSIAIWQIGPISILAGVGLGIGIIGVAGVGMWAGWAVVATQYERMLRQ